MDDGVSGQPREDMDHAAAHRASHDAAHASHNAERRADAVAGGAPSEHPGAERVLRDLEGLEHRPVGEHAAAYQEAHDRLTRELDSAESRIAGAGGPSS